MVFMGFELNMPYYLHRSIFKMAKRYKRNQADTSLFHVGLIKILVVSELGLRRDSWQNFINRNGFTEFNPPLVDKPMVSGDEANPVPYSVLLPIPEPDSPMAETKAVKPITSKARAKNAVKRKRNARMISRMERNKSKPLSKPSLSRLMMTLIRVLNVFSLERVLIMMNLLTISLIICLRVLRTILTILVLSRLLKPVVKRPNPPLLKRLLHPVTSVDYG
jgi:hypothetical protein